MITALVARLQRTASWKWNGVWIPFLKVAVLLCLAWAIYHQVWSRDDLGALSQTFVRHWAGPEKWFFLTALLLVPVNWALETLKWSSLLGRLSPVSFWRSFQAVLAGVAISLFTPNRMGEYGGRVLAVEARNGWKAVLATLVGSLSQWLILFSMGLVGLVVMFGKEHETPWILAGGAGLVAMLAFLFFHLNRLPAWLRRLPFYRHIHRYVRVVGLVHRFRKRDLATALGFAGLRYLTYSIQYFLMLHFLGIAVTPLLGFAGISTLFLFQTSLPLPPVIGLFARGEAALFIWGPFSDQPLAILTASFGLFILNLIVPSLLGAVVIVQSNVSKLLGYEKNEVKVDTGGF